MTIERLSELYLQGYYSKIDFYLGLLNLLVSTQEPSPILEKVPQRLFGFVDEMARAHDLSAGAAGHPEEQRIPQAILQWRSDHPDAASSDNGAPSNAPSENPSRRNSPEAIVPSTER